MEKPEGYDHRGSIRYPDWPEEWRAYRRYKRRLKNHPDWACLTDDEIENRIRENKKKSGEALNAMYKARIDSMSEEERKAEYKKRGKGYKDISPDKWQAYHDQRSKISKDFWDRMDDKQRKEFIEYRNSCWTPEAKAKAAERSSENIRNYLATLTDEQKRAKAAMAKEAWKKKMAEDPEFRERHNKLLRQHNEEFFNAMTEEEKKEFYKRVNAKTVEGTRRKWKEDKEFREKMTKHLQSHARDFVDSLSPEELDAHTKKLFDNLQKYFSNMSKEERDNFFHSNTALNKEFEKRFHDTALDKSFYLEKEYEVQLDYKVFKFWDYAIFSIKNNNLVMVVDLDGDYYHGITSDYTPAGGTEEKDAKRGRFIPDGAMGYIIDQKYFDSAFGEMETLLKMDYDEYLDYLYNQYRKIGFPAYFYNNKELINSMKQIMKTGNGSKEYSIELSSRAGDRIIYNFHRSLWDARYIDNISPKDAWQDDEVLKRLIKDKILFRTPVNVNRLLQPFIVSPIGTRVEMFSAARAKVIIDKYLSEYNVVFDPFSGFSGRMLGAFACGKKYYGQDISAIRVSESNKIINFLKQCSNHWPNAYIPEIHAGDAEKTSAEFDCLFTSVPTTAEAFPDVVACNKSCDEWIDICLSNFKCKRYVFIVDSTIKYKECVAEEIITKRLLGSLISYVVIL